MIRTALLLCLLIASCQSNTKQASVTEEEIQITEGLIQGAFDDLWGGVDSMKILDYHTPDFVILEQGEIWDNDRIKQYMRKQLADENRPKRVNRMEYISTEKYGQSIQIAYYNYAEFFQADSLTGKARWLESALAVETPEGWRLKMMHSTWAGE